MLVQCTGNAMAQLFHGTKKKRQRNMRYYDLRQSKKSTNKLKKGAVSL